MSAGEVVGRNIQDHLIATAPEYASLVERDVV